MNQQELTQIAARGISEQQIAKQLEQIKKKQLYYVLQYQL